MRRFRNFLLKWFFISAIIMGAGLWFINSTWLSQYQWIANGKSYVSTQVSGYYEQQKQAAIHGIKRKIGLEDTTVASNENENSNDKGKATMASSSNNASSVTSTVNANTNTDSTKKVAVPNGIASAPAVMTPASSVNVNKADTATNIQENPANNNLNTNTINSAPNNVDKVASVDEAAQAFAHISIPFFYDHSAAPANMSEQQVLDVLGRASQTWNQACNVSFDFKGDRLADYVDVNNVINRKEGIVKWDNLGGDKIGQAHQGSPAGPARGFVLSLNPVFFSKKANQDNFYSTVLHEMGHVIGLNHSKNPNSIMFWQEDNLHRQVLNSSDKAMCLYLRGRWSGMTAAQASDKFGVLFNESITPDEEPAQNSDN
jgi:hypothetical protein